MPISATFSSRRPLYHPYTDRLYIAVVQVEACVRGGRKRQCLDKTVGSGGSLVSMTTCTGLSWLSVPASTIWYVGASGSSLTHPLPSGQVTVYVNGNR